MSDITLNPEKTNRGVQELQRDEMTMTMTDANQWQAQAVQYNAAAGVQCPYCGTVNEPDALFCATCGKPLGKVSCPNCGAEMRGAEDV